jgi:hypothetical protein
MLFTPAVLLAASVTLAWNPVTESTGYKVYYGSASRTYNAPIDVGNKTGYTIANLPPGTYFFAVTAYNDYGESGFSSEVSAPISKPKPGDTVGIHVVVFMIVPDPPSKEILIFLV